MNELTTSKAALYRKIAAVAGAIEAVEKDGRNKDQGYRYATPASVMSAVKPLMAAQGMAIVPHLIGFEAIDTGQTSRSGTPYILNRVAMEYLLIDGETGDDLTVKWQAQAGTYGDDKGLAKAQTIALRTFLIQLFQIPAEDPESDPDAAGKSPQPAQRPASYEPPRNAPVKAPEKAQAAPKAGGAVAAAPKRIEALKTLWQEEKRLAKALSIDVPTPAADSAIDLNNPAEATIDRVNALGKAAKVRVEEMTARLEALQTQEQPV